MNKMLGGCLIVAAATLALPAIGDDGCAGRASTTAAGGVQVAQAQQQVIDTAKEKATEAVQDAAKEQAKEQMKGAMPSAGDAAKASGASGLPGGSGSQGMPGKDALPSGGQVPKIPGQ